MRGCKKWRLIIAFIAMWSVASALGSAPGLAQQRANTTTMQQAINARDYLRAYEIAVQLARTNPAAAQRVFQDLHRGCLQGAQRGEFSAEHVLGLLFEFGQGVPKNATQAVAWYRKAAERGFAVSQTALGNSYTNGFAVQRDYAQAANWYLKAAGQGFAEAQSKLGGLYYNGQGVPQDYAQAFVWFQKAAAQGYSDGQLWLGVMYAQGRGTPKDLRQARIWLGKAVAQGNTSAQAWLKYVDAEALQARQASKSAAKHVGAAAPRTAQAEAQRADQQTATRESAESSRAAIHQGQTESSVPATFGEKDGGAAHDAAPIQAEGPLNASATETPDVGTVEGAAQAHEPQTAATETSSTAQPTTDHAAAAAANSTELSEATARKVIEGHPSEYPVKTGLWANITDPYAHILTSLEKTGLVTCHRVNMQRQIINTIPCSKPGLATAIVATQKLRPLVVRTTRISPQGMGVDICDSGCTANWIPKGKYTITKIVSIKTVESGTDEFAMVLETHHVDYNDAYKQYLTLYSGKNPGTEGKGRVLLKYDPFKSAWTYVTADLSDADSDFDSNNVSKYLGK
jgi:TPR repeat protein